MLIAAVSSISSIRRFLSGRVGYPDSAHIDCIESKLDPCLTKIQEAVSRQAESFPLAQSRCLIRSAQACALQVDHNLGIAG